MNKEIWEKNMRALTRKYPVWAGMMLEIKRKKRNFDVIPEESMMGDTILKVNDAGKVRYLNGKYAPATAVERWIEQQGKIEEYAPVVIVGVSNGQHIKRIMESVPKTSNILLYEPSLEVFRRALEEVDISFLFQMDIPVGIVVNGINENELPVYYHTFITYDNMSSLKLYISGNYADLFGEEIEKFVKDLRQHMKDVEVGWNTTVRYTDVNAPNIFYNLPYLYNGYNVAELQGILPKDFPVIIVSAGPSLNKNIMELKKAQGKACIIATDTAMKPLLNAGIVPNLFVIVDGLKPANLFVHKDISKVAMVTMTGVSVEPMDLHKGKKFFYYSGSPYEGEILKTLSEKENRNCHLTNIPTGGSVATSAYSLGIFMGSEIVILMGQDLAMTGNRTHADGTFQDKMDEIDVNTDEYFEVESIDGGKVLTRGDFKLYLDWFEKYIRQWNHITTIDATEGGAKIHGAKIMTLKKAIQKYCTKEFNVKWHIDHCKKLFAGENREIPLKYFAEAEKKIQEVRKKSEEGLKYYDKLADLAKKPNLSDKELQKLLKRIKKINNYIERDYMAQTVNDSLKGLESVLRPLIYQMQEDKMTELADVAAQGQVMLYSLAVAAEEILPLVQATVVAYAKAHPIQEKVKDKK